LLIYGIKKLKLALFVGLFISAPKTAVDGCEERPANDKAHIPLTKCFALSDFGWGSLSPALPGPQATGWRWVYMIKLWPIGL